MRRRLGRIVLVAPILLVLAACGQEADGIGGTASTALDPLVQQVRATATSGDRAGAEQALATLRQTVADLRQRGELDESGAARVLAAAADVEAGLASMTITTVTPTVAPATTRPSEPRGPTRTTKPEKSKDGDEDDDD